MSATEVMNRTCLALSPHAGRMRENAVLPPEGDAAELLRFRAMLFAQAPSIGSIPPLTSLDAAATDAATGGHTGLLFDGIAQRLAFERTGTRLYDTLLLKHQISGGFAGGPTLDELLQHRDEEFMHVQILSDTLQQLEADPTAVTPSADLAVVASSGVLAAMADARTTFAQCLEAILTAELVDGDGWRRLIELTRELGQTELATLFERCAQNETEHLRAVQGWLSAGMKVVIGSSDHEEATVPGSR